jgi:hypothetical protein
MAEDEPPWNTVFVRDRNTGKTVQKTGKLSSRRKREITGRTTIPVKKAAQSTRHADEKAAVEVIRAQLRESVQTQESPTPPPSEEQVAFEQGCTVMNELNRKAFERLKINLPIPEIAWQPPVSDEPTVDVPAKKPLMSIQRTLIGWDLMFSGRLMITVTAFTLLVISLIVLL